MPVQEWDFLDKGFSAFLQAKKIRQQEEQFNQEMGMRERQQSLMDYIQRKELELRRMQEERLGQSEQVEQGISALKLSGGLENVTPQVPYRPPEGSLSGTSLLDMFGNNPIAQEHFKVGSYYAPKPEAQKPIDMYEDVGTVNVGGKPVIRKRNKLTGEMEDFPAYIEPKEPKEPTDKIGGDLANLKGIIADVEGLRTATKETVEGQQIIYPAGAEKGMTASDYEIKYIQPQKNKGKIYAEKLIRTNKLQSAVTILKEYLSKGYDLNTSLKMFKEDNPEITADDEEILAGYLYLEGL